MVEPRPDAGPLPAAAAAVGAPLSPAQAERLADFAEQLLRWNRAFNLVSRQDTGRLVPRHLLDSLSVAPWLTGLRALDLGTGAGLPGVPLAIVREDVRFTLVDSNERKIRFLRQVVRALGLGNVAPRCSDVRDLEADATFDTVVCRAVADPATVWRLAAPRLAPGGRVVIMARAGGRGAAKAVALPPDAWLEGTPDVAIPGLDQPHQLMLLRARGWADAARAERAR